MFAISSLISTVRARISFFAAATSRVSDAGCWFNLSTAFLVLLLQRSPMLRSGLALTEWVFHSSQIARVASGLLSVAVLGATHTLAGATQLIVNPTPPVS